MPNTIKFKMFDYISFKIYKIFKNTIFDLPAIQLGLFKLTHYETCHSPIIFTITYLSLCELF